jgi:RHS repeat-associated protein
LATRRPNGGGDSVNVFVYDYLGNVKSAIQGTGMLEANLEYYPYGWVYSRFGAGAGRYTFQGKENDRVVAADFGPRYFAPVSGRFMAPDPVRSSYSPYAYTSGNPIMYNDPTGMVENPAMMAWRAAYMKWWHELTDPDEQRKRDDQRRHDQATQEMEADRQRRTEYFMNSGKGTSSSRGAGGPTEPRSFPPSLCIGAPTLALG